MQLEKLNWAGVGRPPDSFERQSCRLKAAFRLASERRLQAAAKNPVLRPQGCRPALPGL